MPPLVQDEVSVDAMPPEVLNDTEADCSEPTVSVFGLNKIVGGVLSTIVTVPLFPPPPPPLQAAKNSTDAIESVGR